MAPSFPEYVIITRYYYTRGENGEAGGPVRRENARYVVGQIFGQRTIVRLRCLDTLYDLLFFFLMFFSLVSQYVCARRVSVAFCVRRAVAYNGAYIELKDLQKCQ